MVSLAISLPISLIVTKIFQSVRHAKVEPQNFTEHEQSISAEHAAQGESSKDNIEMRPVQSFGLEVYHGSIFNEGMIFRFDIYVSSFLYQVV